MISQIVRHGEKFQILLYLHLLILQDFLLRFYIALLMIKVFEFLSFLLEKNHFLEVLIQ
jgi:hypothetical protein